MPNLVRNSFRVRDKIKDMARIIFDAKIEPPALGYAGLPNITSFVVLLSMERGVTEIYDKESYFSIECLLN